MPANYSQIREALSKYDLLRSALNVENLKNLPSEVLDELFNLLPKREQKVLSQNKNSYFEAACQLLIKYQLNGKKSTYSDNTTSSSSNDSLASISPPSENFKNRNSSSPTFIEPNNVNYLGQSSSFIPPTQTDPCHSSSGVSTASKLSAASPCTSISSINSARTATLTNPNRNAFNFSNANRSRTLASKRQKLCQNKKVQNSKTVEKAHVNTNFQASICLSNARSKSPLCVQDELPKFNNPILPKCKGIKRKFEEKVSVEKKKNSKSCSSLLHKTLMKSCATGYPNLKDNKDTCIGNTENNVDIPINLTLDKDCELTPKLKNENSKVQSIKSYLSNKFSKFCKFPTMPNSIKMEKFVNLRNLSNYDSSNGNLVFLKKHTVKSIPVMNVSLSPNTSPQDTSEFLDFQTIINNCNSQEELDQIQILQNLEWKEIDKLLESENSDEKFANFEKFLILNATKELEKLTTLGDFEIVNLDEIIDNVDCKDEKECTTAKTKNLKKSSNHKQKDKFAKPMDINFNGKGKNGLG